MHSEYQAALQHLYLNENTGRKPRPNALLTLGEVYRKPLRARQCPKKPLCSAAALRVLATGA